MNQNCCLKLGFLGMLVGLVACNSSESVGTPLSETPSVAESTWDSLRQACVDFTNEKRASLALESLERWTSAEACADSQSMADQISGSAHGHFGDCGEFAQNTCPGWPSDTTFANLRSTLLSCLQSMWEEGPGTPYSAHGHFINMSNSEYTQVTCGFRLMNGELWVNQNFK